MSKYNINTTALSSTVTPLTGATPRVYYAPGIWEQITYIVAKCPKEVGWLGMVDKIGNDYLITEIFIPPQTVHGAETDITSEAMGALAIQLLNEGKDPSKLRYWGHSHVNMAVSPSKTDEEQVEEYLHNCEYFIRGIYNKRNETKVDVYDRDRGIAYQCVVNSTCYLSTEIAAALDAIIKENVKEAPVVNFQGYSHNQKKTTSGTKHTEAGATVYVIGKGAKEYIENLKANA